MKYLCRGCERWTMTLKSRCLMQVPAKQAGARKWNGFCINCCCLNKMRSRDCDDPSGLGWVRAEGQQSLNEYTRKS